MRPDQLRWMARIEASTSSEHLERTTTSSIVMSTWTFYRSPSDPTSQCSVLSNELRIYGRVWCVHSHRQPLFSGDLGRKHRCFTEHCHATVPKLEHGALQQAIA